MNFVHVPRDIAIKKIYDQAMRETPSSFMAQALHMAVVALQQYKPPSVVIESKLDFPEACGQCHEPVGGGDKYCAQCGSELFRKERIKDAET